MKLKASAIICVIMAITLSVNVFADDILSGIIENTSQETTEQYSFENTSQATTEMYSFENTSQATTEMYSFENTSQATTEMYSFENTSQPTTQAYSFEQTTSVSETETQTETLTETQIETTTENPPEVFFNEEIGGYGIRNYDGEISFTNPSEEMKPYTQRVTRNNQFLKTNVTIMIGTINFTLTPEQKSRCLDGINTDEPYINKDSVWKIADNICKLYNHKDNELFKTSAGKTITITCGDYGWSVDFTGLTDKLYEALSSKTDTTLTYTPQNANYNVPKPSMTADIGANYAEVDLSLQKVFVYRNNQLVLEDDCVTGKTETPTPTGIWSLKCNQGRTLLKGPTWETWVDNWMHFYDGCGFHDASWQKSFGLERWKAGYGSHGCVNLKPETAEKLRTLLFVGEPVIVHS